MGTKTRTKISRAGDFLRGSNPKSMTGVELMNLARRRVALRDSFKWHGATYVVGVIIMVAIYFFLSSTYCWLIWGALVWGVAVAIHGLTIHIALSNTHQAVSDEYYRLKNIAMLAEKQNGGIPDEQND